MGESGKVILQVSIGVFCRALSKIFSGKDGSAHLGKIGPYAYETWWRTVEDDLHTLNFGVSTARCALGIDRHGDYSWRRLRLLDREREGVG